MRLNIAIFFGALFGALGVLLFLVAFGSDYWLLATEVGKCSGEQNVRFFQTIVLGSNEDSLVQKTSLSTMKDSSGDVGLMGLWKRMIPISGSSGTVTNQPPSKNCTHAYLSPYPFMRGQHNSTSYDSAVSKYLCAQSTSEGACLSYRCPPTLLEAIKK
ncbi:Transmembrane protein 182 [Camelus dromedarius]|uniref:Transmembrane protein 182 n=1 Tax=Camelus dromedarius TaxID=9838 RepID=A0A5N4CCL3_CAMDR|nr:Transmembrane protein 182 [Camelus dromedarius]